MQEAFTRNFGPHGADKVQEVAGGLNVEVNTDAPNARSAHDKRY